MIPLISFGGRSSPCSLLLISLLSWVWLSSTVHPQIWGSPPPAPAPGNLPSSCPVMLWLGEAPPAAQYMYMPPCDGNLDKCCVIFSKHVWPLQLHWDTSSEFQRRANEVISTLQPHLHEPSIFKLKGTLELQACYLYVLPSLLCNPPRLPVTVALVSRTGGWDAVPTPLHPLRTSPLNEQGFTVLIASVHRIPTLWDLPLGKGRNLTDHSRIQWKSPVSTAVGRVHVLHQCYSKCDPQTSGAPKIISNFFHMKIPRHICPFLALFLYNSFPESLWHATSQ